MFVYTPMASVRIGSAFGIPIRLGGSFLLVLPVLVFLIGSQVDTTATVLGDSLGTTIDAAALTGGSLPWLLGLAAALGLFAGVLIHEFGHALVAQRFDVHVDSITLWFLGGLAQLEEFPDDWRQEFYIAVAGPLVSVGVGAACYGAFLAFPVGQPAPRFVFGYLAILNVFLAAFNMLPGFPMDGGRILRALLSRNRSRLDATRIAAGVGKGFAVLLGLGGILLGQIFWIAIAFFIYIGASGETRQLILEAAFEGLTVADVMTPAGDLSTVTPETTVADLVDRMVKERHTGYPVVTASGDLRGIVTLSDVQQVDAVERDAMRVEDVMTSDLRTVTAETEAEDAVSTILQQNVGRLLVVDENGDLAGLVSRTDLMTVFQILQESRSAALGKPTQEPPLQR
jgi:Zn-dependent protease/predicted transcriptional regulator